MNCSLNIASSFRRSFNTSFNSNGVGCSRCGCVYTMICTSSRIPYICSINQVCITIYSIDSNTIHTNFCQFKRCFSWIVGCVSRCSRCKHGVAIWICNSNACYFCFMTFLECIPCVTCSQLIIFSIADTHLSSSNYRSTSCRAVD